MILPWHTDLFQPGRTVCVVFRASPLIWPTSSGAHHAPRPLCLRATRRTPGGFRAGLWVLVATTKGCHPGRRSRVPDPMPQSPWGSPLCAIASAGMTGLVERSVLVKHGFHQNWSRRRGIYPARSVSAERIVRSSLHYPGTQQIMQVQDADRLFLLINCKHD